MTPEHPTNPTVKTYSAGKKITKILFWLWGLMGEEPHKAFLLLTVLERDLSLKNWMGIATILNLNF